MVETTVAPALHEANIEVVATLLMPIDKPAVRSDTGSECPAHDVVILAGWQAGQNANARYRDLISCNRI
jgi:hypothetical protein